MQHISDIIKKRVLLLDGAMGTMVQTLGLSEKDYRGSSFTNHDVNLFGCHDLLSITQPKAVCSIHKRYLEAGADIIETNTFNAQRISLSEYNLSSYVKDINLEAARIARLCADEYTQKNPQKPRFVAGSIGPTPRTCSLSPDAADASLRNLEFDELENAYFEQIMALLEGGVDLLLIETIFDTLNAKAALCASQKAMKQQREVPIMLSVTIAGASGRTLSGQTLEAFYTSVSHYPIFSIGLNCSFGAAHLKPYLKQISDMASCYVSAYPNAGLPNLDGMYDQTPEQMATEVEDYIQEGIVNILGGCCGTTDAHIAAINEMLNRHNDACRQRNVMSNDLMLSGLEALTIDHSQFIKVGERCNVAGSRKFLRLIQEKRYEDALIIAKKQIADGASILDVNLDDGLLESKEEMKTFLRFLMSEPDIARVPIMIDSSDWEVVKEGLKCVQGKCVVNSISLKEGEKEFIQKAAYLRQIGAAVVVMAFDEQGQADTYERKIAVCERAYNILVNSLNFPPQDIIFDPNILAICTGIIEHNEYANAFIQATKWIRQNLPHCHVCGGVSNLSFSFRGHKFLREAMHTVFLHHAQLQGMNMGIVNPSTSLKYDDIPKELVVALEGVILQGNNNTELLILLAEKYSNTLSTSKSEVPSVERLEQSLEEQLAETLVKGNTELLPSLLTDALSRYPQAVDIIEGPLMAGMNRVGQLFAEGKMFLPQVVKTARTMKKAVDFLQPYLSQNNMQEKSTGRVLLATVKGDVHDIGKNIVGLVLTCNGYEVIDLGVNCSAEQIVDVAQKENVMAIGLSGLITPSLSEMIAVARALQKANLNTPLIVGGATTSQEHTSEKIAPVRKALTMWGRDPSQMVKLLGEISSNQITESIPPQTQKNQALKTLKSQELKTLEEAREKKLNLFES